SYMDPKEYVVINGFSEEAWSIWQNRTYGFNIYPSYKITPNNKLSFAASYYVGSHFEYDQAYSSNSVQTINYYGSGKYKTMEISAAYLTLAVEDEIKLGSAVVLSVGVSYDMQDVIEYKRKENINGSTKMLDRETGYASDPMLWGTQDSFNPVIGITGRVTKDLKLRGSASYKTSFPSLQAYANTVSAESIPETRDDSSYEELKPEKSINGNAGVELAFFDHSFILGCDYFISSYHDRLVRFFQTKKDDYIYRNMDASYMQGSETTLKWDVWDIFDAADISLGLTHTYIYARNLTKMRISTINKGVYFERLPEHKFTLDFRMQINKTKTNFFVFGYYEYGQIQYAMKYRPDAVHPYTFTTKCWTPVRLNDPLMIDVKISQKIFTSYGDFEAYLMCKNIMDDYLADPFNPGPGRMFYAGLKAGW
ncbi:MAG: TonB-dependent receptor, partial [Leptospirales bacterium]|nr:TonB-dependent receptor [Leptospirales bacterium]